MIGQSVSRPQPSYREQIILDEVSAIAEIPYAGRDGWLRAHHVKFFRGGRVADEIRSLTLEQITGSLRQLAHKGWVERHPNPRIAEYRLPRSV